MHFLSARLGRDAFSIVEQVVDRLVARRRDADAHPVAKQLGDELRRVVRLPRARRPLDEEVALVAAREVAAEDRAQRRVSARVLREARERASLRACPACPGSALAGAARPPTSARAQTQQSASFVDLDDLLGSPFAGSTTSPGASLCCCVRNESVNTNDFLSGSGGASVGSSPAIASRSQSQAPPRSTRSPEELPPHRSGLAPVVLAQLRRRPALVPLSRRRRAAPAASASHSAIASARSAGTSRGALGSFHALDPGLGAPLEQPVAQRFGRAAVELVVALDRLEQRVVAGVEPLLEDEDRVVAGADVLRRAGMKNVSTCFSP